MQPTTSARQKKAFKASRKHPWANSSYPWHFSIKKNRQKYAFKSFKEASLAGSLLRAAAALIRTLNDRAAPNHFGDKMLYLPKGAGRSLV